MTWLQAWIAEDWPALAAKACQSSRALLVETAGTATDQRLYLHIDPARGRIRRITSQQDVNDGSVTIAWLDLDANGKPVGLELILAENPPT